MHRPTTIASCTTGFFETAIIIATKLDKIKRSQLQKQIKLIRETLEVEKDTIVIPFSAETKQGREEIWNLIDEIRSDAEESGE